MSYEESNQPTNQPTNQPMIFPSQRLY